jgi:hypothetical protein
MNNPFQPLYGSHEVGNKKLADTESILKKNLNQQKELQPQVAKKPISYSIKPPVLIPQNRHLVKNQKSTLGEVTSFVNNRKMLFLLIVVILILLAVAIIVHRQQKQQQALQLMKKRLRRLMK